MSDGAFTIIAVYLPLVAHLTLFALLLTLVWSAAPRPLLAWWGGAIVGVSVIRTIFWTVARRRNLYSRSAVLVARATMLALGLAWGVGAASLFRHVPVEDVALILLGLTGLLAGGLVTLVADRWTFPTYAIAMFGPPTVVVGVTGPGLFDELAVVLMLIFLAFSIRLHLRSHDALRKRLRVEASLRDSQRQLSEAQRIAHVGSWEWDIETNTVTWSDEMRHIFGLPLGAPASFAGFLERVHPDDRSRIQGIVAASVAERQPADYDWRTIRPDGEERLIHTRNMVVTGADGRAVRMVGTALDITERTRAEENQRTLLRELQASLTEVKVLKGILPICATCKRIRGDDGEWEAVESYVRERTNAEFTHGLCPDCAKKTWA